MDLLNLLSDDMLLETFENIKIGNILGIYNSNVKLRSIVNYLTSKNKIKSYRLFGVGNGKNNVFGNGIEEYHYVKSPIEINLHDEIINDIYNDGNSSHFLTIINDLYLSVCDYDNMFKYNKIKNDSNKLQISNNTFENDQGISYSDKNLFIFNDIKNNQNNFTKIIKIVYITENQTNGFKYYLTDNGKIYYNGIYYGKKYDCMLVNFPYNVQIVDVIPTLNFGQVLFLTKTGDVFLYDKRRTKTKNTSITPDKMVFVYKNDNPIIITHIIPYKKTVFMITNKGEVYLSNTNSSTIFFNHILINNPYIDNFYKLNLLDIHGNQMIIISISVAKYSIIFINDKYEVYVIGRYLNSEYNNLHRINIFNSNGIKLNIIQVSQVNSVMVMFLTLNKSVYIVGNLSRMGLGRINVPEKLSIIDNNGIEVKVLKIKTVNKYALFLTE